MLFVLGSLDPLRAVPQTLRSPVFSHLYSCLVQLGQSGQFLPAVDIRIMALGEGRLQFLQLLLSECSPVAAPGRSRGMAAIGTCCAIGAVVVCGSPISALNVATIGTKVGCRGAAIGGTVARLVA